MIKLNEYNTIDDILSNKRLKEMYDKTEQIFNNMVEKKKKSKCVFCGREYKRSNFSSCKGCKQPNMLIKYGFVDSGRDVRYERRA